MLEKLELERRALRLTPDEWMIPLFGESEAVGKRDVLEGRLVWLAMRALRLGVNVVLDFGAWGRDERSALRSLAAEAGAECQLVYLPVHEAEQLRRVQTRSIEEPGSTFEMSPEDLQRFNQQFQAPDEHELTSGEIDPAPAGLRLVEALGRGTLADSHRLTRHVRTSRVTKGRLVQIRPLQIGLVL